MMNKNSKIYVAGHTGLVGSAIYRKLKAEGYINLLTRSHRELDLIRQEKVQSFFESEKPEYVFLAAARVGGILANNSYPADFLYNNIMIQTNVIHSAYSSSVKKLVFLGSSCIYPRDCPQPMKEEYLLSGKLEPTNEPYAIAKIAGIKMCQSYNRQYGTCFVSIMPTNLYGPGDNFDLETSHALPALIRKFHEAKVRGANLLEVKGRRLEAGGSEGYRLEAVDRRQGNGFERGFASNLKRSAPPTPSGDFVTIWGTGAPRREFLYVDDLADAAIFVMNNYDENGIINIGVGKDISISELAEMIKDIVGYSGGIRFDHTKPDGMPRKILDISRLESFGWRAKISLRDGIKQTYKWYVKNKGDKRRATSDE
jgi:GDP-L-fucose synthase